MLEVHFNLHKNVETIELFVVNFGPSEVRETSGANLGRPLFKVLIFFFIACAAKRNSLIKQIGPPRYCLKDS